MEARGFGKAILNLAMSVANYVTCRAFLRTFVFKYLHIPMRKTFSVVFSAALLSTLLVSCGKRTEQATVDTTSHIAIIPAPQRAYPDASLSIVSPKEGETLKDASDSVRIVMQVSGTDLGIHTDGDSTMGIAYSKQGQHFHVIVDSKPYMANYKSGEPFNIGLLAPGMHTIRAFPSFSWHESIKSPHSFATRTFYVGSKSSDTAQANNLNGPLLTYSRPKGTYASGENSKVLLDFYVSNATLAPDAYKVKVWVDTTSMPDITKWQPYYITGLTQGKHTVKLQLIAPDGSVVPGSYNSPTGEITIQ